MHRFWSIFNFSVRLIMMKIFNYIFTDNSDEDEDEGIVRSAKNNKRKRRIVIDDDSD